MNNNEVDKILEDAYAFKEGKTYMIQVDTDELIAINKLSRDLQIANPKINWIVVPSSVKPIEIHNQNFIKILEDLKGWINFHKQENGTLFLGLKGLDNLDKEIDKIISEIKGEEEPLNLGKWKNKKITKPNKVKFDFVRKEYRK